MVSSMAAFLGYCCGAGTCLALWCMMCIYKTMWCIFYIYIVTNDLHMFWIKIFIYDRYVRYLWCIIIMSRYIMNYLWLFVYTCSNGIWINSFGYPEMGISPVLWWSAMEYGWIWNMPENVGRKGPFLLIICKIQALQVPIGEGHIHMFVQSDFSLVCGGVFGNFLTLRIAECWSCPLCFALIQ
jgi:hypothetical protein